MKKLIFVLWIFILIYPSQTLAQPVVNFITDGYVYINYECVTGQSTYTFDVPPVFRVTGLVNGQNYEILTDQTNIFGTVIYETTPWDFTPSGNHWKWENSPTFDSIYFEFDGNYSKWTVGAHEFLR